MLKMGSQPLAFFMLFATFDAGFFDEELLFRVALSFGLGSGPWAGVAKLARTTWAAVRAYVPLGPFGAASVLGFFSTGAFLSRGLFLRSPFFVLFISPRASVTSQCGCPAGPLSDFCRLPRLPRLLRF